MEWNNFLLLCVRVWGRDCCCWPNTVFKTIHRLLLTSAETSVCLPAWLPVQATRPASLSFLMSQFLPKISLFFFFVELPSNFCFNLVFPSTVVGTRQGKRTGDGHGHEDLHYRRRRRLRSIPFRLQLWQNFVILRIPPIPIHSTSSHTIEFSSPSRTRMKYNKKPPRSSTWPSQIKTSLLPTPLNLLHRVLLSSPPYPIPLSFSVSLSLPSITLIHPTHSSAVMFLLLACLLASDGTHSLWPTFCDMESV